MSNSKKCKDKLENKKDKSQKQLLHQIAQKVNLEQKIREAEQKVIEVRQLANENILKAEEELNQLKKQAQEIGVEEEIDELQQNSSNAENYENDKKQIPALSISSVSKAESNNSKDFQSINKLFENLPELLDQNANESQEINSNDISFEKPIQNKNIFETNQISTNTSKRKANQKGDEHQKFFDQENSDEKIIDKENLMNESTN